MLGDGSLALVVVGGLLGVGGTIAGVIGTAIRDQIQQRYDTKKRRAEKFEELVGAVYEFDHWIEAARDRYVYGRDVPETVSPFAKVQSISSIYFPQFRALVGELNSAVLQYRVWMLGAQGRRLNGLANINEGFNEAYEPYWRKCNSLLDALQEFAREHFQDEGPAEQKPPPPVT